MSGWKFTETLDHNISEFPFPTEGGVVPPGALRCSTCVKREEQHFLSMSGWRRRQCMGKAVLRVWMGGAPRVTVSQGGKSWKERSPLEIAGSRAHAALGTVVSERKKENLSLFAEGR